MNEYRALLDLMDQAILVCDDAICELRYANEVGTQLVTALGGSRAAVTLIASALAEADAPVVDRFGRAVERRVDGRRLFVRARRIPGQRAGVFVVVTEARIRRDDVISVLHARHALSRRQCELVVLVRDGKSSAEIATQLELSEGTVRQYLSRIYETLGVTTRTRLVARVEELLEEQFGSRS